MASGEQKKTPQGVKTHTHTRSGLSIKKLSTKRKENRKGNLSCVVVSKGNHRGRRGRKRRAGHHASSAQLRLEGPSTSEGVCWWWWRAFLLFRQSRKRGDSAHFLGEGDEFVTDDWSQMPRFSFFLFFLTTPLLSGPSSLTTTTTTTRDSSSAQMTQ